MGPICAFLRLLFYEFSRNIARIEGRIGPSPRPRVAFWKNCIPVGNMLLISLSYFGKGAARTSSILVVSLLIDSSCMRVVEDRKDHGSRPIRSVQVDSHPKFLAPNTSSTQALFRAHTSDLNLVLNTRRNETMHTNQSARRRIVLSLRAFPPLCNKAGSSFCILGIPLAELHYVLA